MRRLGIVNQETWSFMEELSPYLERRFLTEVFAHATTRSPIFRERLNRRRLSRDLRTFLRSHDVVFFEWASELLARATQLHTPGRIVTRLHRYELYTWASKVNWDAVDRVILVSRAKEREFLARFPGQAGKTRVVPVGVPLARFTVTDRPFAGVIGTLCHLTPRKRVYELILSFADMLRTQPSLRLRIAGGPEQAYADYDEALRSLVAKLGLESRVTFDGPVAQPWTWYPQVDIFVSHSYSEGLQVAPMEAMASGCLVLAHAWDGADELVPPDCLYLRDADLVAKVVSYCDLPESERTAQRHRMRAWASDRFDSAVVSERVGDILDDCLGDASASPGPGGSALAK